MSKYDSWRLPKNVTPNHYELMFDFGGLKKSDMIGDRFIYHGTSRIQAKMEQDSCEIIVHTNFDTVVIKSVHLRIGSDNVEIATAENKEKQLLLITPEFSIKQNTHFELDFTFMVNVPTNEESLDGLYSSYYDDENGQRNYLLTTQFEAWGARMAFPCFDEPSMKAIFDVSMSYKHYDNSYTALFNTDVFESSDKEGVRTDKFYTSMQISPYLLAIVVSPLTKVTDISRIKILHFHFQIKLHYIVHFAFSSKMLCNFKT